MRRTSAPWLLAKLLPLAVAAALIALQAGPAAAHEQHRVGRYQLAVGFGDEPAYVGSRNSVQVLVTDAAGRPVTDLGGDLAVMVERGDQMLELPLEPYFEVGEWGIPGDYRAFLVPTAPGRFGIHVHGSIKGQRISQQFRSGPDTFSDVEDPAKVQFPVRQPSPGELAQRLDREVPRLSAAVESARVAERAARRTAAQARVLAVAGLAVGVVGLLVAALALSRARRRPAATRPELIGAEVADS